MPEKPEMDEERVIEYLRDLGLNEYQSRAYVATVSLVNARPSKIVEESGVPQARIYDVIDDLSDMGLVEVHERSGGKTVSAPSPEIVLDSFKERHLSEYENKIELVSNELEKAHDQQRNTQGSVTMLSHDESAVRHMRQALDAAEWWVSLSLTPDLYEKLQPKISDALDRGVTVRLVIATDAFDTELEAISFPHALHVRSRSLSDILVIADRTYGVFSSKMPIDRDQSYIVVQEVNLALQFQQYYEQIWTSSHTIQDGDSFPRRYLDPWRAILDLQDALDSDEQFEVEVEGYETASRTKGMWKGQIVDYELEGPIEADYAVSLPVTATLTIDTGDEQLTVGGWKANLEDIATEGLLIDRVS